jgi:probable rRNA maturation factor
VALDGEQASVELLIRIVGEDESGKLNRRFRGVNRPTNVLAFPLDLPIGLPYRHLGDLVICAPVVRREARAQGKPEQAHWAHMVVHGVSHLLGYDHGDEAGAQVMEQREIRLLAQMGFANPYTDVADA